MKKTLLILFSFLAITSCKNYLDVQPQGMVLPSTDEEFASIIHSHLRDIEGGGDEIIIGNMKTLADREGCADDLDANIRIGDNMVSYAGEIINLRQSDYRNTWTVIRDCNIVIENLKDRESSTARETLSAAYAIKGVCYYNLIRDFCEPWQDGKADHQLGLPIVDHFDIEAKPARTNLKATADYALDLLDKSLLLKPENELYLFTEYIVKAFKARLLFWIEDWNACSQLCEDIMEHSGISLSSREEYAEVINAPSSAEGEVLFRSHINNSSELDWYFSYIRGYIASRPAAYKLIRLFGAEPEKDIRYQVAFDSRRCNTKLPEMKIRISEILLMRAECEYHKGNEMTAIHLINTLRSHRIEGLSTLSLDQLPEVRNDDKIKVDARDEDLTPLLQVILDERRKELYMEGDRWYELKRNGRPEWWIISNGLKYTTETYMYTAPIYKGDVDMNPAMKQNPGYIN